MCAASLAQPASHTLIWSGTLVIIIVILCQSLGLCLSLPMALLHTCLLLQMLLSVCVLLVWLSRTASPRADPSASGTMSLTVR